MKDAEFHLTYADLGQMIIEIPPKGAVLLYTAKYLSLSKNRAKNYSPFQKFITQYAEGVVIIERFERFGEKKRQFIQQLFLRYGLDYQGQFPGFIPTRSVQDTVACIQSIARREQREDLPPSLSRVKIASKYLYKAQEFFIEGLLLIGPKKSQTLLNRFDTPWAIIQAIINTPEIIVEIKGFGEQFIVKNRPLLLSFASQSSDPKTT
jgi:ERCC4-type nuclease